MGAFAFRNVSLTLDLSETDLNGSLYTWNGFEIGKLWGHDLEDPHSRVGGIYSDTGSQSVLMLPFLGTGMDLAVGYRAVSKQTRSRDGRETAGNLPLAY